ncbi:unnamed protein product, partial [Adineta steineri]
MDFPPPPPTGTEMNFPSPSQDSTEIQMAYARLQRKHLNLKK